MIGVCPKVFYFRLRNIKDDGSENPEHQAQIYGCISLRTKPYEQPLGLCPYLRFPNCQDFLQQKVLFQCAVATSHSWRWSRGASNS
jgi:hypothetical protein